MKLFIVIAAIAATLLIEVRACECACFPQTTCTNRVTNKFTVRRIPVSEIPPRTNVVVSAPNITTNFSQPVVVQPVIVQPVVVQQPVYVSQPVYYVERQYHTPGRVGFVNLPFVASAGVSISSYPSHYNTGTYWRYDSARQERHDMYANQAAYRNMFGGHRSYGPNYNNNPYGSVPSVGAMFNHSGGRRH